MQLIEVATLINIAVGIFNIMIAVWQMVNNNIEWAIFNLQLAICSFLIAIVTAIISNRKNYK